MFWAADMSRLSPTQWKTREKIVVDPRSPEAAAVCDGCGLWVPHRHLRERKDYRGGSVPVGTGLWVCGVCDDVPQPYFALLVLPPDPVPVRNPRLENLSLDPEPMQFVVADTNTYIITGVNPYGYTNDDFNYLVANNP